MKKQRELKILAQNFDGNTPSLLGVIYSQESKRARADLGELLSMVPNGLLDDLAGEITDSYKDHTAHSNPISYYIMRDVLGDVIDRFVDGYKLGVDDFDFAIDYTGVLSVDPSIPANFEHPMALSIRKWEKIVTLLENDCDITSDGTVKTCALCVVNWANDCNACYRCPIGEFTKNVYCQSTPYSTWAAGNRTLPVARAELEYLRMIQSISNHP